MYLDEIVSAQENGEAKGITSVCSAHPYVIQQTLRVSHAHGVTPLIEATCNQVNQYGGYTGMTPKDFVVYVRGLAKENQFPFENIILGGDHLGPNVWQNEPAESAMQKAETLIQNYVQAGFTKIHLDCSMKLGDDPQDTPDPAVIASRTARLAQVAERSGNRNLRYIIGAEVPIPGGAILHEEGVNVTKVEDVIQGIDATRAAFLAAGLVSSWERVVGVVVQPGVEFGDDFVLPYNSEAARNLSTYIETQPMIYEAHSTDYQRRDALRNMVRDHFAILKVGPALTFAFREAVFILAMIENELIAKEERSNIIQVLDDVMLKHPEYWKKYYHGTGAEQAFKRKYSLSDRIRYYWVQPEVQAGLDRLWKNVGGKRLPYSLSSQFMGDGDRTALQIIEQKIGGVLEDYQDACLPTV